MSVSSGAMIMIWNKEELVLDKLVLDVDEIVNNKMIKDESTLWRRVRAGRRNMIGCDVHSRRMIICTRYKNSEPHYPNTHMKIS